MLALKPYSPPAGFTFDPVSHEGRMNGELWPSVTQLITHFGLVDYSGVPEETMERKRILGTNVHYATGLIDECDLDEEHQAKHFPSTIPYLEAYRKYRVQQPFEPSPKCGRLVSRKLRVHGEPDEHGMRIENIGNRPCIVEYKCCYELYPSTSTQTAGYQILIEECLGIKIKGRYGLLLRPDGSYELERFTDAVDRQDFLACVHLWHRKRNKYKTIKFKDLKA